MRAKSKKQVLHGKNIRQRSCVACREIKAKKDLIRFVCSDGVVEVDAGGKKPGRGAYLCPAYGCWEVGLNKGRMERALRTKLALEERQALLEYGEGLFERLEGQK